MSTQRVLAALVPSLRVRGLPSAGVIAEVQTPSPSKKSPNQGKHIRWANVASERRFDDTGNILSERHTRIFRYPIGQEVTTSFRLQQSKETALRAREVEMASQAKKLKSTAPLMPWSLSPWLTSTATSHLGIARGLWTSGAPMSSTQSQSYFAMNQSYF